MNRHSDTMDQLSQYYSAIYRKYDLVNRIFTLGNDERWRKYTAEQCLKHQPRNIIDLCCGTGDLAINIRKKAANEVKITGFDFNRKMLEIAKRKTEEQQLDNLIYVEGDVAEMPFADGSFDAMTIGFGFRNLTFENEKSVRHLMEMNRIIRKGGRLYILESSVPSCNLIRMLYKLYLRLILIPLGAWITGNREAYAYLARSSANFFNTDEVADMLINSGFIMEQKKVFFLGASNLIIAMKT